MAFEILLPLKVLETFATLAKVESLFGKRKDAFVGTKYNGVSTITHLTHVMDCATY